MQFYSARASAAARQSDLLIYPLVALTSDSRCVERALLARSLAASDEPLSKVRT
jgi:hypothetical protein